VVFYQKTKDLWNAAGVGVYEHLGDQKETLETMHKWVKPDIYNKVMPLWAFRFDNAKLKHIDHLYDA